MVKKYTKHFSLKNWNKKSNEKFSSIANTIIMLEVILIPAILNLPISDTSKLWINSVYGVIAAVGKILQKLTTSENVGEAI